MSTRFSSQNVPAGAAGPARTRTEPPMPIDRPPQAPCTRLLALLDHMSAGARRGAPIDAGELREAIALAPTGPHETAFLAALGELARAAGDTAAEASIRAEVCRRRRPPATPPPADSHAAPPVVASSSRTLTFLERFPSLNRKGPVVLVSRDIAFTFPLSYAYLAGALVEAGEQVKVFFKDRDPARMIEEIMRLDPVLVGFGSLYPELQEIGKWISAFDRLGRKFPIAIGGQMVSPHPEFSVEVTGADFGAVGEAEISLVRLVKAIRARVDPDDLQGWVVRRGATIQNNGAGEYVRDLSALPAVPYHLFPTEKWLPVGKWYAENLPQAQWREHDRVVNVHGGRGCPFRCNFCYHHSKPRYRPVSVMMREAEQTLRRFDANMLYFSDDLVLASRKRLGELVSEISRLYRPVTYSVSARFDLVDRLTEDELFSLRQTGCRTMGLGIESGSDRMLKKIGKRVTSAQIARNLGRLHRVGILPTVSIMVGQITETREDAEASVELVRQAVRENPNINFAFTYTTPFPGSELYDHVLASGLVRDHRDYYQRYFSQQCGDFKQVVNLSAMSADEVHHMYGKLCSVYLQEKERGRRRAEEEKLELYRFEDARARDTRSFAVRPSAEPSPSPALRIHTDRGIVPAGADWVAFLAPLWGSPDGERHLDAGRFEAWGRAGRGVLELASPGEADIAVLPFEWRPERHTLAARFAEEARRHGRRTLVFFGHDSVEPVPIDDALVLRTSLLRQRLRPGELAMPAAASDFVEFHFGGELPVKPKSIRPTVTFCGYVPAPAAHPRRRAVEVLARCTRLDPLIVERGQFWGGTAGDRSSEAQRVRREYVANLAAGEYALCVRGAGNFSFRLYEALSCGRIPVLVDTDCVLPDEDHVDWRSLCVYVDESELHRLEEAVLAYHDALSPAAFEERQRELRRLWVERLSPHGFFGHLLDRLRAAA